jgi:hypothetical protein
MEMEKEEIDFDDSATSHKAAERLILVQRHWMVQSLTIGRVFMLVTTS